MVSRSESKSDSHSRAKRIEMNVSLKTPTLTIALLLVACGDSGGESAATLTLIDQLRSGSPDQRETAAVKLATEGGAGAVKALVRALDDVVADVRIAAAKSLKQRGDAAAVDGLAKALDDPDPRVRAAAAEALGAIDDDRVIAPLIAALADDNTTVRHAASIAVAKAQPADVSAIIALLEHDTPGVRATAASLLADLGAGSADDALVTALADDDAGAVLAAIDAVGRLGVSKAAPALGRLVDENEPTRTIAVCRALAAIDHDTATDTLVAVLRQQLSTRRPHERLTVAAVESLGDKRSAQAIHALLQALNHKKKDIAAAAHAALKRIGNPVAKHAAQGLDVLSDRNRADRMLLLGDVAPDDAPPILMQWLSPAHPYTCAAAATALGQLKYVPASDKLIELTELKPRKDRDREVEAMRSAAFDALARLANPHALQTIHAKFRNSKNYDEQIQLVNAMLKIGDPSSAKVVSDYYVKRRGHMKWRLQMTIIRALGNFRSPDGVPGLAAHLKHHRHEWHTAAQSLARIPDPRAMRILIDLIDVDLRMDKLPGNVNGAVIEHARDGLVAHPDISIPLLIDALNHQSKDRRTRAMEVLVMIGKPSAPALRAALRESDATATPYAIIALTRLDVPGRAEAFAGVLQRDLDADVQALALSALGAVGDANMLPTIEPFTAHENPKIADAASAAIAKIKQRRAADSGA